MQIANDFKVADMVKTAEGEGTKTQSHSKRHVAGVVSAFLSFSRHSRTPFAPLIALNFYPVPDDILLWICDFCMNMTSRNRHRPFVCL